MEKLKMQSKNLYDENLKILEELFPECMDEENEKKFLNIEKLKLELGNENIEEVSEKYQLTWAGKRNAIINSNTPTKNTLRAIKNRSVNFNNTKNIYIEGDNLETLKILQESYLNKIKCIYIDTI